MYVSAYVLFSSNIIRTITQAARHSEVKNLLLDALQIVSVVDGIHYIEGNANNGIDPQPVKIRA